MNKKILSLLMVFNILSCSVSAANVADKSGCVKLTNAEIIGFFDRWNHALETLNLDNITALYDEDAVFLPNSSGTMLKNRGEIRHYFTLFLQSKPMARVDQRQIIANCHFALDTGFYTFSILDRAGERVNVTSNYTFIYRRNHEGKWYIESHQSSGMPQ